MNYTLDWDNSVSMTYGYVSPGCYDITLAHYGTDGYRIWVSDESNKERNVDTEHHELTDPVKICTKWLHVHIKNEG